MPARSGGEVVGVVMIALNIDFLNALTADEKIGRTGYTAIADNQGLVIAHQNADCILKLNVVETKGMERFGKDMVAGKSGMDSFVSSGIIAAVAALIYRMFSRTITRPLVKGVSFAQAIARGTSPDSSISTRRTRSACWPRR